MSETPRLHATPPGVVLGPLADITDGGARNYVLQLRAGRFHGFVVRQGEQAFGYVDRCPHWHLPLARTLDDYLAPGGARIQCGWHGALFQVDDGRCVAGPCAGGRLLPWPVEVVNGLVRTSADHAANETTAFDPVQST